MRIRLLGLVFILGLGVLLATMSVSGSVSGQARTVGQIIDDAALVASIKTKLTAEKLSNLMKIDVKSDNGVVTLSGTVDSLERRARAVQIASGVEGVKQVVDNLQVAEAAASPSPPATAPAPVGTTGPSIAAIDATGTVARVDPTAGTIALQDGRVLTATDRTVVWQSTSVQSLQPGTQVLVRGATPTGFESGAAAAPRMGTVRSVDRSAGQFVLTDGTVVRVTPSTTVIRRGAERVSLDALEPGSEVVVKAPPAAGVSAIEASEVDVVWAPTASAR
jgi:hyperosmotically inducible periplasmic protein